MSRSRRSRVLALAISIAAAALIAASVTLLLRDYLDARRRAPGDRARLESLELAVREDATRAPVLTEEYVRQRDETLARRDRHDVLTAFLIVSSVVFLIAAKSLVALGSRRAPNVRQIQAHRGDLALRRRRRRSSGVAAAFDPGVETGEPEIDLGFVDEVIAEEGRSREAAIAILQRIQTHYRYLPDAALQRVCELTEIRPAQIAGVSSFYAQFRRSPCGKYVVKVCHGTACHVSGAREINEELRRHLGIAPDSDTDSARRFTLDEVACVGCCSLAPVLVIEDDTVGRLSPVTAVEALEAHDGERQSS